ncbi:LapA family protein [uncultured Phascolarctobacterium sp.]|uniref:LapA family protein n=2 Tax=uncultured Phascolarctobacterium sp. TaxID=512296 RepID=UPI0025DC1582|nr:LapA family protein [uncultured Phascolarctobacterium sp.]
MPFLILVIIICMLVALFAVQNAVAVSLNFVLWSFSTSLVLVILGSFLMGVLVATCFMLTMKAKHYLKDKKMREEMQQLEAENKRLQERVAMLQHTQLLHNEAAQAAAKQAEPAADKAAAESGSRQ